MMIRAAVLTRLGILTWAYAVLGVLWLCNQWRLGAGYGE